VVVLVLRGVLMFHGSVQMKQRCCKHSDQETSTEYCYASSSHKPGMVLELTPCINSACTRGDPLDPLTMHHGGRLCDARVALRQTTRADMLETAKIGSD